MPVGHTTWIVVADGGKALFLQNRGVGKGLSTAPLEDMIADNPADREQGTDRPGRAYSSVGPGRSAYDETDWHRFGKEQFAREVARRLNDAAQRGRFDRLIVIAPPQALGDLRQELDRKSRQRIHAEIPKDLTNHDLPSIESQIGTVLAV
ncbi:host attachment family protein [Inquilinus sp. CAU 1745]|uniref:host attachment family protein n=1 Tax=Inquilinus sp. CAU 1745 TaxID=3140369 RepID=UPI00325A4CE4